MLSNNLWSDESARKSVLTHRQFVCVKFQDQVVEMRYYLKVQKDDMTMVGDLGNYGLKMDRSWQVKIHLAMHDDVNLKTNKLKIVIN